MTKTRIAVVVSLLFAAPAAVVALEQSASVGTVDPNVEIQATAPEAAAEPSVGSDAVVVVTETTVVAEVPAAEPAHSAKPRGIMGWLRASAATEPFPIGYGPDEKQLLPAQAAYFDRIDQERSHLIARGDVFPKGGSVEDKEPLPAVVAYFDREEQQRLASMQPRQRVVARIESDRRSSEEVAQAGSAELSLADSSAIR